MVYILFQEEKNYCFLNAFFFSNSNGFSYLFILIYMVYILFWKEKHLNFALSLYIYIFLNMA